MLWRALRDIECGFYVDVGAADPTINSVTRAFYERGWSGFNIEPTEPYFTALESQRPRDVNLRVLAGARAGVRTLHIIEGEGAGLSTVNGDFAAQHVKAGYKSRDLVLPELQLNQILETRAGLEIHFLKIDVEGAEADVLSGIDLKAFRPWIILVEATEPNSQTPSRYLWEHLLIKRDYEFAYFDGLNCFYTAIERAELKEKLAVPPNVFDDFLPFSQARLRDDVIQQTYRAQALVEAQAVATAEIARFEAELGRTQAGQAKLSEEVRTLSRAADNLRLDSRLMALEELAAELKRSLLGSSQKYDNLLSEYAEIVRKALVEAQAVATAEITRFEAELGRTQAGLQYLLNRSILEKLFFRVDGRPVRGLGRLLFHKSGKPRKLFRILILDKNGKPRRAFSYWMTSQEEHDNAAPGSPPAERERALCVELMYRYYLGRGADADGLRVHIGSLRNGMTLSALARVIENSPEAVDRRQRRQDFDALSDGEFVVALAEFLFQGRGALPEEVEHWKNVLSDDRD